MNDTPTQTIADALLLLSLGERNEIGKDASERLMKLERENAALRADKERLDWLSTALGGYWACEHFQHRNRISRIYIDAGMADNPTPAELKEGKP
jgi:hypothetical protein